MFNNNADFDC